jgi:hypothetical protein
MWRFVYDRVSAIEESAMLLGHMAEHIPRGADVTPETFRNAFHAALAVPKAVRAIIGDGRNEVAANLESEAG